MRTFPPQLFSACADILSGEEPDPVRNNNAALSFLRDLGYCDSEGGFSSPASMRLQINLLTCAEKLDLFAIDMPDAPGLLFIGGRVLPERFPGLAMYSPSNTSGIAATLVQAYESNVGEAVEFLSQLSPVACNGAEENSMHFPIQESHTSRPDQDSMPQRLDAICLGTEEARTVPAKECLRQPGAQTTLGMSTGCAAGPTHEQATVSAILELIERDAAALWWEGGQPPRPIALEAIAEAGIESLFAQAGRESNTRMTLLLDITSDLKIPCVAALSADLSDGSRFACGLASRVNLSDAIRKAVFEMMQMELGHHVLEGKRLAQGDSALNAHDRQQIKRSQMLKNVWNTPLVQSRGRSMQFPETEGSDISCREKLLETLIALEHEVVAVDLTRDWIGVPAVKVFIPTLQSYPLTQHTPRLSTMIAATGGTVQHSLGLSLL